MMGLAPKRIRLGSLWSCKKGSGLEKDGYGQSQAYCAADQLLEGSTKPFTDMRPSAAWRATVLPPEELKKKFTHPLFAIPGVNALSLKLDILHVLDLGVSAYLHGSVLVSIMDKLGGTSSLLAAMWFSHLFKSTKGLVFQNIRALFFGQRAGQPFL